MAGVLSLIFFSTFVLVENVQAIHSWNASAEDTKKKNVRMYLNCWGLRIFLLILSSKLNLGNPCMRSPATQPNDRVNNILSRIKKCVYVAWVWWRTKWEFPHNKHAKLWTERNAGREIMSRQTITQFQKSDFHLLICSSFSGFTSTIWSVAKKTFASRVQYNWRCAGRCLVAAGTTILSGWQWVITFVSVFSTTTQPHLDSYRR